jgi:NAD+ synthase (glutamine-hydrolysing)
MFAAYTFRMQRIRLAAAAVNQTPLAWEANRDRLLAAIAAARDAEASVLCLPELAISGYGCEDQFFSDGVQRTSLDMLIELVPATHGMVVCVGLPVVVGRSLFNGAAVLCDGALLGIVLKQHLAGDGLHYEPRWFRPWLAGNVQWIDVGDETIPVGDMLFEVGPIGGPAVRIGVEICRDAWVADRPGARLAAAAADIILNPTASHFAFAKQDVRRRIVLEGSRTFNCAYVFANLLGNESGRAIFDGGTHIATTGRMVAEGPRLSFADHVLTCGDVDVGVIRRMRVAASTPSCPDGAFAGEVIRAEFELPDAQLPCQQSSLAPWDTVPPMKEEEFARSTALALFDYLRKSRANGYVISLSGGADSSAVATLVWLMVKLGVAELGADKFAARLGDIAGLAEPASVEGTVGRLLLCAYQATRYSSETTRHAAAAIAKAVGAEFHQWNIDELVDGYLAIGAEAVGRDLTWDRDDVALQNVQARARGPAVWLLANLRGALLLTTSNRSEAAVGYATMDGDTCGGLAPIAGIDKAFLLHWLQWMEHTGPLGVGWLPALSVINALAPTAELRPPDASQTDEGDLMPYRVLDAIERAAIRDKKAPVEVFKVVRQQFSEYAAADLGSWVERFFTLWCRNQWKRERYAPSFHLDDENLDPKTWCRFPILNSGFERELDELHRFLGNLT